jgi:outer membrane protein assembly factor BamB
VPTTSTSPATRSRPRARLVGAAAAALVAIGAISGAGAAYAQTDGSWTQFQGDEGHTGAAPGPDPGFREAWRLDVAPAGPGARYGLAPAVVAGDVVVAVGPAQVVGVDVATGAETFAVDRDPGPSVPAAVAEGPGAGGSLVVYTQEWADGPPDPEATDPAASPAPTGGAGAEPPLGTPSLAAFAIDDQAPPWDPVSLDGVSRTGVTASQGVAFVGTNRGTVYAIDLGDGSIAWQRELDALLATSVAVAGDTVLVGLQGDRDTLPVIVALDASTGEERWRHEPDAAAAVVSALAADGEAAYAIFSGFSETRVEAIDTDDGALRWSRRVNGAFDVAPPLVGEEAVIVTDLVGHTRALALADGAERWDFAQNVATFRSVPALIDGSVVVPSRDGDLGVIDALTGELVWRLEGDGHAIRAVTPAGDLLVVVRGGGGSGLQALEHDPDAALLAEASPTTADWGPMLATIALAAVPVLAVVLVGGRWLARRPQVPRVDGDRDDDDHEPDADDEPVHDPWEDDAEEPT